ncbi:MAG: TorF family putative porin [Gammaproteobacteria bacterium]
MRWLLALLPASTTLPAAAQALQAVVGASSDYVYRGLSQTGGDAAVHAGAGLRWRSGLSAGVWASTIDSSRERDGGDADAYEIDLLLGASGAIGGSERWSWDAGVGRYLYVGDARELDYDYTELAAGIGYRERLRLSLAWSPDRSGYRDGYAVRRADAYAAELAAGWPLALQLRLLGGVGYHDLQRASGVSYRYWSAGLGWQHARYAVELLRIGSDRDARERFGDVQAGTRTALTVSVRFGG